MSDAARSIDHAYVERNALLARYRARQLSPEEADEFEVHYLDCEACRSQLEEDEALADGFKAAAIDGLTASQSAKPPTRRWLTTYALAASVLIIVLTGLLMRRTEQMPTQVIALMTTRQGGESDVVPLAVRDQPEFLVFVIDAVQPELSLYNVTVTAANRVVWSARDLTPQQTLGADRLVVSIPGERLQDGELELTVAGRGRDDSTVRTGTFRLRVTRQP